MIFFERKKFLICREKELSGPKIKKIFIFSQKIFPYVSGNATLQPSLKKLLKFFEEKRFLHFGKWNFLAQPEKTSYIFRNRAF